MMIFPPHIEKKYNVILTFALAIPFLRPRDPSGGPDPQVGKPWPTATFYKHTGLKQSLQSQVYIHCNNLLIST